LLQQGVIWLHKASKLANTDAEINNEIDYIASVFRYYKGDIKNDM
jgi:hypothetical protein